MTLTHQLIVSIQVDLMLLEAHGGRGTRHWQRLERAECYLIKRFIRNESPEEREAFNLIWPPAEIGGEG